MEDEIDAATATVDVEDTRVTHHPEYSTTAQFQDLHLGQFCKFCAPAIADLIAKWAVKRRIKGCCVTSMHIYVTQHSRRTTTNGSDA